MQLSMNFKWKAQRIHLLEMCKFVFRMLGTPVTFVTVYCALHGIYKLVNCDYPGK